MVRLKGNSAFFITTIGAHAPLSRGSQVDYLGPKWIQGSWSQLSSCHLLLRLLGCRRGRGHDYRGALLSGGAKHGPYQPITHRPHSQASRGSGHWGCPVDLFAQLVIPNLGKALSEMVGGKDQCPYQPLSIGVYPRPTNDEKCGACRRNNRCLEVHGHHEFHMEGRLCQSVQLPGLPVLRGCASALWFSRGLDMMGQAMRHHPLLFSLGGWQPTGGVDPSPVQHSIGLPLGAITVRPRGQCFGHLHPTILLWRTPARFSNDQLAIRDPTPIVRQQHNFSA